MGFELHDGVWEITSAHGGTGDYPLDGKPAGGDSALHTFGDVFDDGDQFFYRAWRSGEGEEEGVGEYDATNDAVTRIRPIKSTNGNAAVDWGAGGVTNLVVTLGSGVLQDLVDPSSGTGLRVRTANETYAHRALAAGANITLTNADGVAGNPQIAVDQGSGSGLDADTLDGQEAAAFAAAAHDHSGLATTLFTGGSNSKILRYTSDGALTTADQNDTPADLTVLYARGSDGKIYLPGSMVPFGGLSVGNRYWLGDNGAVVSGNGPTPSSTVTAAFVGRCDKAGYLTFWPALVVKG